MSVIVINSYRFAGGGGAPDTTAPTLSSATIATDGVTLTLVFDEAVSFNSADDDDFTITASGGAVALAYTSGSGTDTIVCTLGRTVESGETVTFDYVQPGNGVEDLAGNDLGSINDAAVTNNSTQTSGVYPLDVLAGASEGWSVTHRLSASYSGNLIRAWRVSDDAEQDFGCATGTDELDTAALVAWAGGGEVRLHTVYNQVSTRHLVQTTEASMPSLLDASGALYDGALARFTSAVNPRILVSHTQAQPITDIQVINNRSTTDNAVISTGSTTSRTALSQEFTGPVYKISSGTLLQGSGYTLGAWNVVTGTHDGANSSVVRDLETAVTGTSNVNGVTSYVVGASSACANFDWRSKIVFPSALSDTDRETVVTALMTLYGIV